MTCDGIDGIVGVQGMMACSGIDGIMGVQGMMAAFEAMDTNNDGVIDRAEWVGCASVAWHVVRLVIHRAEWLHSA